MTVSKFTSENSADQAYLKNRDQFLERVDSLRPKLHRFAARMCGSVVDGEDVIQEALAQAFFKLDELVEIEKLESWMFTITHRKALDFIRSRKKPMFEMNEEVFVPEGYQDDVEIQFEVNHAIKTLIVNLPPKERACVVLKNVLGFSLAEIAKIVDSSEAGVKAALHRGRLKLSEIKSNQSLKKPKQNEKVLIDNYIKLFNQKDWGAVEQLLQADARLEVVGKGIAEGRDVIKDNYFVNYSKWHWEWQLGKALVDGDEMVVHFKRLENGEWQPHATILFEWSEGLIQKIRDYLHVDYLLHESDIQTLN